MESYELSRLSKSKMLGLSPHSVVEANLAIVLWKEMKMSEDLKRQWYVQNEDEIVAGSFESGDVFWRIADCHTPEIAQRVCELHNASLPELPLLTAANATEKAREQYEEVRHQKPLDTNKELRAWLELMACLLNQRDVVARIGKGAKG